MLGQTMHPTPAHPAATPKLVIKAVRPALTDLRFRGDAAVVREGKTIAVVCLGDCQIGRVRVTKLDVPSMNRTLEQIRTGQARRVRMRRMRKEG